MPLPQKMEFRCIDCKKMIEHFTRRPSQSLKTKKRCDYCKGIRYRTKRKLKVKGGLNAKGN